MRVKELICKIFGHKLSILQVKKYGVTNYKCRRCKCYLITHGTITINLGRLNAAGN